MNSDLITYLTRLEAAQDFSEKWHILTGSAEQLGFNVVNLVAFQNGTDHTQPLFYENFRHNWFGHYQEQGYAAHDAMIPAAANSQAPVVMLKVDEKQPLHWSDTGRRIIAEAADAGMARAVGFSHRNRHGIMDAGMSFGSDSMSLHDFHQVVAEKGAELYTMFSIALQHMGGELFRQMELQDNRLTGRQYDVLMALWDGCSNKEIAYRLGISEVTVSFHLAALRDRLGCTNNREIIPRAYLAGYLHRMPEPGG